MLWKNEEQRINKPTITLWQTTTYVRPENKQIIIIIHEKDATKVEKTRLKTNNQFNNSHRKNHNNENAEMDNKNSSRQTNPRQKKTNKQKTLPKLEMMTINKRVHNKLSNTLEASDRKIKFN